ncbi:MAG: 30S ribosomal protein S16 [Candidatus Omnitrophica bacterium]|nr:30S ribosomal protein S16 [Candidatus Omnitrophota bacterium]
MSQVMIRLKRFGTKKRPHSRIVVIDKHRARDGEPIEELGYYDPSREPPMLKVNVERAKFWIGRGAVPSPTVKQLLKRAKAPAPAAA